MGGLFNRGKVRGWRRRLRHVEELRDRYAEPDGRMLEAYGYCTFELHLAPWGNLRPRTPPPWLRRRILDVMLDVHARWTDVLAAWSDAHGQPADVMLWLCHPRFGRSQVVAAVGDAVLGYRGTFFEPYDGVPARPPALYDDPAYDLGALDWTPGVDCDWTMGRDFDDWPGWRETFDKRFADQIVDDREVHGERVVAYRRGMAWVGRRSAHP